MGLVRELAVVANRSTRRGGARDEGEDEQEIFKALPLDYWTEEGKMEERRGEERTGKGRKGGIIVSPFPLNHQNPPPKEREFLQMRVKKGVFPTRG